MRTAIIISIFILGAWTCVQHLEPEPKINVAPANNDTLLYQRFAPPEGYSRTKTVAGSFEHYLRQLPLKPIGSKVKHFDGTIKPNQGVYEAVVDLPIGNRDLHQCADAVMRLRAEYLWRDQQYDQIHFNLTNGFLVDYNRWKSGQRVLVNGNTTTWTSSAAPSNTYATFWQYLEFVFAYAGTLSLSKELTPVAAGDLQTGDVFIRGGSPGHAVMVVDLAADSAGNKLFMLAQSYMPAQDIQILQNPADKEISPWYRLENSQELETPEWRFGWEELKRFKR